MPLSSYIDRLENAIVDKKEFTFENNSEFSNQDIVLRKDNKRIFIEIKDAKNYGELPLSTAIQLKKIKASNPDIDILLVSFSYISDVLKNALKEMNVEYLIDPTIEETTQKLHEIAG
ncbi:MAG TPA: hypothetical protein VN721_00720 [Flavipsychrobacter sp.]|nr:hypothetical protein [Flavipsychrobacter sp.]